MEDVKRYVIVQAIKVSENEFIPIWDERIVFEKSEEYGNGLFLQNSIGGWGETYYQLHECVFDLKTKKLVFGIELNYYPNESEIPFKRGETVLFEKSHKFLAEAKISEIVFEKYKMEIKRGRKLEKWWLERFKNINIDGNVLYAIKIWKPFYLLDNGIKIEWEHQLYRKSVEE